MVGRWAALKGQEIQLLVVAAAVEMKCVQQLEEDAALVEGSLLMNVLKKEFADE